MVALITARNLKTLLMNRADQAAQADSLFETVLNTVALNVVAQRGARTKGIMEMTVGRAAVMQAAGKENINNLDKRLDNLRGNTIIFTPHPNWALSKEAEVEVQKIYDQLLALPDEEFQKLEGINTQGLFENLKKPERRLTVAEEWERTDVDAQKVLESIPIVVTELRQTRNGVDGSSQKKIIIPAEELEQYVGLVQAKSWGLDRDSKPNVTAAVMEAEIEKQIGRTRTSHIERLNKVHEQIKQGGHSDTARSLKSIIDQFEADKNKSAAWLAEELLKLKENHEKRFKPLPKHGETDFSVLDMAYVQIKTAGECWPKGEIRQNAAMHATAIRYARSFLPRSIMDQNVNDIESELNSNPQPIKDKLNAEIDRLSVEVKKYYAFCEEQKVTKMTKQIQDDREAKMKELGLDQQQIDFYETFAGLRVANKYPHAIHSYVIAETGVMDKEDLENSVLGRKITLRADHGSRAYRKANPLLTDAQVEEMARDQVVSERVKEDLLSVMFMKFMTTDGDHKAKAAEDKLEIIPLFESFDSITQGWESLDRLEHNTHYIEYIKKCGRNKLPTIYDAEAKQHRTMTIAEAKEALGIEPKEEDKTRFVESCITVMHAGSDAMRENGLGIGPLNTHYQERVQEKLIEQGIWVEIYQGTGASVHRSHPPSPHVARYTQQGGERYHSTPESIAWQILRSIAISMANMIGYTLPEQYMPMLAAYPGHMGNSLLLPKEPLDVKKETRPFLDAACKGHSARFDDPLFETFFKECSAYKYTKMFNFSARPDGRVGVPELVEKVRAIGYSMSLFATGSNNTLIGGMNGFFDIKEPDYKLSESHCDKIIGWMHKSPKIQEMMTRLTHAIATANMDTAWAFQGIERIVDANGDILLTKKGDTVRLNDLLEYAGEAREDVKKIQEDVKQKLNTGEITQEQANKELKERIDRVQFTSGFGIEAIALAEADKEYQTTAKALYEIYRRMQIEQDAKYNAINVNANAAAEMKNHALSDLKQELAAPYFDPKKIFDIMTVEMAEELKEKMKPIDKARWALANHHNGTNKLDEDTTLYRAFATCMEGFETGVDACLRHTAMNFSNDMVLSHLGKSREAALKGKEYTLSV